MNGRKCTELDAVILFRAQYFDMFGTFVDFYMIDPQAEYEKEVVLHPDLDLRPTSNMHLQMTSCVVSGGTVYLIGGTDFSMCERGAGRYRSPLLYNNVYSRNLYCSDGYWEEQPPLIKARAGAYAAASVDDGKIYVFGSIFDRERVRPWAEVLGPSESDDGGCCWRALSTLETPPGLVNGHVFLDGGNQILLHTPISGELYLYDIKEGSWKLYSDKCGRFHGQTAFVDGIMYGCNDDHLGVIFGYDVSDPKSLPIQVEGLKETLKGVCLRGVVSLGNDKLSVVWSRLRREGIQWKLGVSILTFSISKETKESGDVSLEASQILLVTYILPEAFTIVDFHAIKPLPPYESSPHQESEGEEITEEMEAEGEDTSAKTIKDSSS